MNEKLKFVFFPLLLLLFSGFSYGQGSWRNEHERQVVLTYGDPTDFLVSLVITYPRSDCKPIASIMIMQNGTELGSFIARRDSSKVEEQMTWRLDGQNFTARTSMMRHSSGSEVAMLASPEMMMKLEVASTIAVWVGTKRFFKRPELILIPLMPHIKEGFVEANLNARNACLSL